MGPEIIHGITGRRGLPGALKAKKDTVLIAKTLAHVQDYTTLSPIW